MVDPLSQGGIDLYERSMDILQKVLILSNSEKFIVSIIGFVVDK